MRQSVRFLLCVWITLAVSATAEAQIFSYAGTGVPTDDRINIMIRGDCVGTAGEQTISSGNLQVP